MKITIEISEEVRDAFRENLNLDTDVFDRIEPEVLLDVVIKQFLNDSIDIEDIDLVACQYIDSIESSGELEDIIYENTLK